MTTETGALSEREAIAKIVDPSAFMFKDHYIEGSMPWIVAQEEWDKALTKADAILALRPPAPESGEVTQADRVEYEERILRAEMDAIAARRPFDEALELARADKDRRIEIALKMLAARFPVIVDLSGEAQTAIINAMEEFAQAMSVGRMEYSEQALIGHRLAALRTPPAGEQPVGDVGALVERLRGLLAAATKRPWRRFNSVHGNDVLAIMKGDRPTDGKWPQIITWAGFDGTDVPKRYNVANLELIVEAVNALPTLLAALSSLSAQVAGMREALEVGLQAMGTAERVDWAIRARAAIAGGEDGRG